MYVKFTNYMLDLLKTIYEKKLIWDLNVSFVLLKQLNINLLTIRIVIINLCKLFFET